MGLIASSQPNKKGRGSLRGRLTRQVVILAALGLGGITAFAAMQMRQMLIGSHQRTLNLVADRFANDVVKYAARYEAQPDSFQASLEMAVQQIPAEDVLLWVSQPDRGVLVRSEAATADPMTLKMLSPQIQIPSRNKLIRVEGDRYLLVCGIHLNTPIHSNIPVSSQASAIAPELRPKLYLAYDVTLAHRQYTNTVQSLAAANLLLLVLLTGAIAYSVRQATEPLNKISATARQISATKLGTARLEVQEAPAEIEGLVDTFNAMLLRLADAWEKQRQFVNDASHELRTPLAIVHGYLQSVLRRQGSLNELQKEALGTAAEETQRTIDLLQEMLTIARAENGQIEFDLKAIALQPLLIEAAATVERLYGRTVQLQIPPQPVAALADATHLRQALVNLLDNAVKYSEPGDLIQLSLKKQKENVRIEVRDGGIGIAPEQLDSIFERFYRADEARHRQGGTGLGLSLVKTLVQGMGGQITVQSKLKEGSIFSIVLPQPPG